MLKNYVFTSESVSDGHPDKVCDQISDALVDFYLTHDPQAHIAVETLATTNRVVLAGEIKAKCGIMKDKHEAIVRDVVKRIGYEQEGFHWKNLEFSDYLHGQSVDIDQGVDRGEAQEQGAGDQGIMFGYACSETPCLMPAPIYYAHKMLLALKEGRENGALKGLLPDAKSQLTLQYEDNKPQYATRLVISTQHEEGMTAADIKKMLRPVVSRVLPQDWMCADEDFFVNPTGRFVIGGPDGDAGVTGRKIIVDTYGGAAPHGGGAFSGKDPSKVDRSAAYMMRYLAKNVVASGLAERCTMQVSYGIGLAKPLSLYLDTHGTGRVDEAELKYFLLDLVDLTPAGIERQLDLRRPIYGRTASYGHFGRDTEEDGGFSWEKCDLVEALQRHFFNRLNRQAGA